MIKQLLLDLGGTNDEKHIRKIVSGFFAPLGEVNNLKVFDLPEHDSRVILVTLDDQQAATDAINRFGLVSFGERSLVITVPNRHD